MGIDERYEGYRSRGDAPRRRGAYEGSEPPAGRSSSRGPRDDAPRPRSRDFDDPSASRGPSRRGYGADEGRDPRYDRPRSRPDQSSPSGRRPRIDPSESGPRRERRPDGDSYGRMPSRGQQPRDGFDARPRGPRGASPADSGARMRRPAAAGNGHGGLWGDDAGAAALRGRPDPRDPRARRGVPVEEEESGSGVGTALGAIVLALILGAGAAYGYYTISTPKLSGSASPVVTPAASPSAKPGASPTVTPKANTITAPTAGRGPSAPIAADATARPFVFVTATGAPQA